LSLSQAGGDGAAAAGERMSMFDSAHSHRLSAKACASASYGAASQSSISSHCLFFSSCSESGPSSSVSVNTNSSRNDYLNRYGDYLESSSWGMGYQSNSQASSNSAKSSVSGTATGNTFRDAGPDAGESYRVMSSGNFSNVSSWKNHNMDDKDMDMNMNTNMEPSHKREFSINCYGIHMHIPVHVHAHMGVFKLGLSWSVWLLSYLIMGYLGGSVAYMHFPRTAAPHPMPLPDYGYDLIPEYCPLFKFPLKLPGLSSRSSSHPDTNIQSFILMSFYIWFFVLCWLPHPQTYQSHQQSQQHQSLPHESSNNQHNTNVNNQHHQHNANNQPNTKTKSRTTRTRVMVQQLLHLNVLVFLSRTTTVGLTGMPQPNPRCVDVQHFEVTFEQAIRFVMGRGFPPHACGDLLYSGHVACTLCCMVMFHQYPPMFLFTAVRSKKLFLAAAGVSSSLLSSHQSSSGVLPVSVSSVPVVVSTTGTGTTGTVRSSTTMCWRRAVAYYGLLWSMALTGIYFVLSCRSHYTVDVVLAGYFVYFLQEWYFTRSRSTSHSCSQGGSCSRSQNNNVHVPTGTGTRRTDAVTINCKEEQQQQQQQHENNAYTSGDENRQWNATALIQWLER
jgi:hypothetical protein